MQAARVILLRPANWPKHEECRQVTVARLENCCRLVSRYAAFFLAACSLATVTPSLLIRAALNDLSMTTPRRARP